MVAPGPMDQGREAPVQQILALLVLNGLLKSLQLGEPYFTPYFISKGLTAAQINNQVFPWWEYCYTAFIVLAVVLSPRVRPRGLMLAEGAIKIVVYMILVFGNGLLGMQIAQGLYGLASALAYGYSIVPSELFPRDESYSRNVFRWNNYLKSIPLVGKVAGSFMGQAIRGLGFELVTLFQATLVFLIAAFVLLLCLPRWEQRQTRKPAWGPGQLFPRLGVVYSEPSTLLWTLIWSINSCAVYMIMLYGSSFWNEFRGRFDVDLSGLMNGAGKILGAVGPVLFEMCGVEAHSRWLSWIIFASTAAFAASAFASAHPSQSPLILTICWPLSMGLGYTICSLVSGILMLRSKQEDQGFMLSFQLALCMVLQSVIQLVLSSILQVSLQTRSLTVSAVVGSTLLLHLVLAVINR